VYIVERQLGGGGVAVVPLVILRMHARARTKDAPERLKAPGSVTPPRD
jgi:hypothetical protein